MKHSETQETNQRHKGIQPIKVKNQNQSTLSFKTELTPSCKR